ncbi:MAG: hypothetical protein BWZ10_01810 [candidate division BRC1 bacterium ADurb.BinA364]|nr:MAG: hypothetical protein BWZ10_01810 [candidate division BRC1 bacterium ADurb.BinA364]
MQIFLLWRSSANDTPQADIEARQAAERLLRIFSPLFATPPSARILRGRHGMRAVYLEKPVEEWNLPYLETRGEAWALSLDYAPSAERALRSRGIDLSQGMLLPWSEAMEDDPEPYLREIAPPFGLVWRSARTGKLHLANDGLGGVQLFEYSRNNRWAIANRMMAFAALGLPVELEPADWAVRLTCDWFPQDRAGYRGVRMLDPGTVIRFDEEQMERRRFDSLSDWTARRDWTMRECEERAWEAIRATIVDASKHWTRAIAGLTGGYDSRITASVAVRERLPNCDLYVRGRRTNPETRISAELAEKAGAKLVVDWPGSRYVPESLEALLRNVEKAVLWQAGYPDPTSYYGFLNGTRELRGGNVVLTGEYGGVGRGYYAERIHLRKNPLWRMEANLIRFLASAKPFLVRSRWRSHVRETLLQSMREAKAGGRQGDDALEYFMLMERIRRFNGGGHYFAPGLMLSPLAEPDFFRAIFSYPIRERQTGRLYKKLAAIGVPSWAKVQYLKKQLKREERAAHREMRSRRPWVFRREKLRQSICQIAGRPYFPELTLNEYWQTMGAALIDELLKREEDPWSEVLDMKLVKNRGYWVLGHVAMAIGLNRTLARINARQIA